MDKVEENSVDDICLMKTLSLTQLEVKLAEFLKNFFMEEINKTHPDLDSKKIKDFKLTINSIEHDRGTNLGIMVVDKKWVTGWYETIITLKIEEFSHNDDLNRR